MFLLGNARARPARLGTHGVHLGGRVLRAHVFSDALRASEKIDHRVEVFDHPAARLEIRLRHDVPSGQDDRTRVGVVADGDGRAVLEETIDADHLPARARHGSVLVLPAERGGGFEQIFAIALPAILSPRIHETLARVPERGREDGRLHLDDAFAAHLGACASGGVDVRHFSRRVFARRLRRLVRVERRLGRERRGCHLDVRVVVLALQVVHGRARLLVANATYHRERVIEFDIRRGRVRGNVRGEATRGGEVAGTSADHAAFATRGTAEEGEDALGGVAGA